MNPESRARVFRRLATLATVAAVAACDSPTLEPAGGGAAEGRFIAVSTTAEAQPDSETHITITNFDPREGSPLLGPADSGVVQMRDDPNGRTAFIFYSRAPGGGWNLVGYIGRSDSGDEVSASSEKDQNGNVFVHVIVRRNGAIRYHYIYDPKNNKLKIYNASGVLIYMGPPISNIDKLPPPNPPSGQYWTSESQWTASAGSGGGALAAGSTT